MGLNCWFVHSCGVHLIPDGQIDRQHPNVCGSLACPVSWGVISGTSPTQQLSAISTFATCAPNIEDPKIAKSADIDPTKPTDALSR
jgi:hypothetical protein